MSQNNKSKLEQQLHEVLAREDGSGHEVNQDFVSSQKQKIKGKTLIELQQQLDEVLAIDDGSEHKPNENSASGKEPKKEPKIVETKHTLVTSPWSRLLVIGVTFGIGFLIVFLFLNAVFHSTGGIKVSKKTSSDTLSKKDKADGDIYARLALSKQESELSKLGSKPKSPTPTPTLTPVAENKTPKVVQSSPPPPQPRTASSARSPMAGRATSPPQPRPAPQPQMRSPTAGVSPSLTTGRATSQPQQPQRSTPSNPTQPKPVDPNTEFARLRSVGSFGTLAYISEENREQSQTLLQNLPPSSPIEVQSKPRLPQNVPTSLVEAQSTPRTIPRSSPEKISPRWTPVSTPVPSPSPSYLPQEEQILHSDSHYLVVGQFASGKIMTSIVKPESDKIQNNSSERFLAQLTQDLNDNQGNVALPSGTSMILSVISIESSGYAQVQVTSIIKDGTEYPVSEGAITVQGAKGNPLIAHKVQDKGGEIFSLDATLGVTAGLSKVGEIINQPDSQSSTQVSGTVSSVSTSTQNGNRNIAAAFLQGAFGDVSKAVSHRADTSTQEILKRPNIWIIPTGTNITFIVNRTLEFP